MSLHPSHLVPRVMLGLAALIAGAIAALGIARAQDAGGDPADPVSTVESTVTVKATPGPVEVGAQPDPNQDYAPGFAPDPSEPAPDADEKTPVPENQVKADPKLIPPEYRDQVTGVWLVKPTDSPKAGDQKLGTPPQAP